MSDANPSRLGQIQATGDEKALYLKLFSGEVLTAFETNVILKDKQMTRHISGGKSAQFPATWRATSGYHTPGAEVLGDSIEHNEIIINLDPVLFSSVFVDELDEAQLQFDIRGEYSSQLGQELARQYDANVCRNILLAARAGALFSADTGGSTVTNAAFASDGDALAAGVYAGLQQLEEKDVPLTDVYAAYKPAQYYLLLQSPQVLNRDFGGSGSYAEGSSIKVGGITIQRSNNFTFGANDSTNTAIPAAYRGNWTNSIGMLWHKSAVGTAHMLDMKTEVTYDERRFGTLMTARYACGHGKLRSKAAIEFATA